MLRRFADFVLVTVGVRARFWPRELVRRGAKSGVPTMVVISHYTTSRAAPPLPPSWTDCWLRVDGRSVFRIRRLFKRRVHVLELEGGWHEVAIRIAMATLRCRFEVRPSEAALVVIARGVLGASRRGEIEVSVCGVDGKKLRSYSGVWTGE